MHKTFIGKTDIELHGSGMVWIEAFRLLCAADIHFEKGSFFHQFGAMLPPYDSDATLGKLETAIAHFKPDIFIALGDSFHDAKAVQRMEPVIKEKLNQLIASVERWVWVTGNHDPIIHADISGERSEEMRVGELVFRHEHKADEMPELSGHYHPKATITLKGRRIVAPCFVQSGAKLILPSFGAFTGGLDIDSADFVKIMPPKSRHIYMLYKDKIYLL